MKLSLDKFKTDWRNATIGARIKFILTILVGIVGAVFISIGHIDYDRVSDLWITDTNWTVGIMLYILFTLMVVMQGEWKMGK